MEEKDLNVGDILDTLNEEQKIAVEALMKLFIQLTIRTTADGIAMALAKGTNDVNLESVIDRHYDELIKEFNLTIEGGDDNDQD